MASKKRILFATKNPGKLLEFTRVFRKFTGAYEVISFNDLGYDIPDCDETGETFAENALIKVANAKSHLRSTESDMIVVADDSGMEIDALNGEPGVHTRRWSGARMADDEIIAYCLSKMAGVKDRAASYVSCFAIMFPDGTSKVISSNDRGVILTEARPESQLAGMPFRSLFFIPALNMMFHKVRDIPVANRKGYKLGHESAIQKIIDMLP